MAIYGSADVGTLARLSRASLLDRRVECLRPLGDGFETMSADVSSKPSMFRSVFRASHSLKILGVVVISRAVDVMNMLIRSEIAPIGLLPIQPVFRNISLHGSRGVFWAKNVHIPLRHVSFSLRGMWQLRGVSVVAADIEPWIALPSIGAGNVDRRNGRLSATPTQTEAMSRVIGRRFSSAFVIHRLTSSMGRGAMELMTRNEAPRTPFLGLSLEGLIAPAFANSHASIIKQGVSA